MANFTSWSAINPRSLVSQLSRPSIGQPDSPSCAIDRAQKTPSRTPRGKRRRSPVRRQVQRPRRSTAADPPIIAIQNEIKGSASIRSRVGGASSAAASLKCRVTHRIRSSPARWQILAALGPQHGYGIARRIEQVGDGQILLNQGTIYAALVRLQQGGWIAADWGTSDNNRCAKFYTLTQRGRKRLVADAANWRRVSDVMERFLDPSTQPEASS